MPGRPPSHLRRLLRRYVVVDVQRPGEIPLPNGRTGTLIGTFQAADLALALAEAERKAGRRALVYDTRYYPDLWSDDAAAGSGPAAPVKSGIVGENLETNPARPTNGDEDDDPRERDTVIPPRRGQT